MNLNHIAKKPFFDMFYKSAVFPNMLKGALYDAGSMNAEGVMIGGHGAAALKTDVQRNNNR